ncbi:MAG: hypothetical protein F2825_10965 [Actinobacteria bacterium]|uniref:Unannotated protein n=1 Tax=freshwater metagenome TaxID=449393 RepID=A0A6J7ISP2_9ZZZZ|nr:hypothetical protein [Actinomycetota bacterium]
MLHGPARAVLGSPMRGRPGTLGGMFAQVAAGRTSDRERSEQQLEGSDQQ